MTDYNPRLTVTVANGIVLPVELKGAMVIKGRSTPYSTSTKKYVPVVILDAILVPGLRKDTVLLSPRALFRLQGVRDSRRLARSPGRVDRSSRSSGPLVEVEWTVQGASGPRGSGEWESFKGRLDATRGPLARSSGRTGSPLAAGRRSTRCGEAPGAAVDSPGRVDRRQYLCRRHFLCRPFL